MKKGKKGNLACDLAIYFSREMTGESGVALDCYFGGISGAGITVRYKHIENKIEKDHKLKRQAMKIRKKISNI